LVCISWAAGGSNFDFPLIHTAGVSVLEVFYAGLVLLAFAVPSGAWARVVSWSPLRSFGKYSYAIYVYHFVPHLLLESRVQHMLLRQSPRVAVLVHLLYVPVLIALSYGVARLSWLLMEGPLLRLKDRNPLLDLSRKEPRVAYP
jgi:peptidoglycan/LPS O-acetylase OafA/YrhL